ncbi:MAG: hypothetical protein JW880_05620 [Candidatus Thermoplasmatota archaeon]|nr:hypothetical protein [Candidatus Thermoplasmatota archaeon]
MAKKLRRGRRSPAVLAVELFIPWVVMAGCALALFAAGQSELVVYAVSLLAALGVTVLVHLYEKSRRGGRRFPND